MDERLYRQRTWTDAQLCEAVVASASLSEVGRQLGLKSASAANRTLPKHIARLGLSTEHLVGRGVSGNRTSERFNKRPLSEVLVQKSTYTSTTSLKKRLLREGLLKYECYECFLTKWLGKDISLQLDHKNGNRQDCRIENLRLLCPNCHSQTETYAGKNKGKIHHGGL